MWLEWESYLSGKYPHSNMSLYLPGEPETAAQEVAMFLRYLRVEKGKSHQRACDYLTAVRFHFEIAGASTTFFEGATCGRARKASARGRTSISRRVAASGGTRTTPIQLEWILRKDPRRITTGPVSAPELMVFTAVFLAFHLMLRVSEYTAKSKKSSVDHALKRKDVVFEYGKGRPIKSKNEPFEPPVVVGVRITIRSTKTSKAGVYYVHELRRSDSGVVSRLIETLAFWYYSPYTSDLSQEDLLFEYISNSHTRITKKLNSRMVGTFVKDLAEENSQPRDAYSTHSLRVGGAEAMRVAGHDIELINRAGRWAPGSTAAITYRTPAVSRVGALAIRDRSQLAQHSYGVREVLSSEDSSSGSEESIGLVRPSRR
jgi:hypothetical protein